jgi:hypothetical protein
MAHIKPKTHICEGVANAFHYTFARVWKRPFTTHLREHVINALLLCPLRPKLIFATKKHIEISYWAETPILLQNILISSIALRA